MGTVETKREAILKPASPDVLAATQKTLEAARARLLDGTTRAITDDTKIEEVALFDDDTQRLMKISSSQYSGVNIEYMVFGFNKALPELQPVIHLPKDDVTSENTMYLGANTNPNLADDLVSIATSIARANLVPLTQYDEHKSRAIKTNLVHPNMRAPFSAAGKRIVESATTIGRRLNPLRA